MKTHVVQQTQHQLRHNISNHMGPLSDENKKVSQYARINQYARKSNKYAQLERKPQLEDKDFCHA